MAHFGLIEGEAAVRVQEVSGLTAISTDFISLPGHVDNLAFVRAKPRLFVENLSKLAG